MSESRGQIGLINHCLGPNLPTTYLSLCRKEAPVALILAMRPVAAVCPVRQRRVVSETPTPMQLANIQFNGGNASVDAKGHWNVACECRLIEKAWVWYLCFIHSNA